MFKGRPAGAVVGRVGLVLALTCAASEAAAGKIAGVVREAGSGSPLPAANVVLVDTRWGAAADAAGRFFILNIPPGAYTLKITYVGYSPLTLEDVRVSADLTTRLDVVLEAAGVQVEEVVVRAERPLIDRNATNAVRILDGADLEMLPLRGVHNALGLQTGMVEEQGRFHVRGSRSDEIGYYVEGANVRNIVTGFSAVELIDEALAEVQLQAGGFNAEYGGANGGIVLQELRTGGPQWDVDFLAESDRFTSKYRKRLGTFSYGYSNQVLTLSGPLAGQGRVRLFAAGQRRARDSRPVFWDGFEFSGLADSGDRGGSLHWGSAGLPDSVRVLSVRPGNIDHSGREALIFNGTLLFDYNPFQVRCTGLYSQEELKLNPAPVRNILNQDRLPRTNSVSALLRAQATHLLDPSLFYQLSFTRYRQGRKSDDPLFEDHFWVYNDSAAVAAADKGFVPYFRQGVAPRPYDLHGFPFNRFGAPTSFANGISDASFFFEESDQYWGLAGSMVKQTRVHQLKLGFDYQRWTSRRYLVLLRSLRAAIAADYPHLEAVYGRYYAGEIGAGEILAEMIAAASAAPPGQGDLEDFRKLVRRNSQADFYGFDEFGRRRDGSGLEAPRRPAVAAAFIQDKVEYRDLILNAGLRYDYFDVDSWRFQDPAAPVRDAEAITIDLASMRRTRRFHRLSPRLGLSFPASDRTVFHVQYGRFVQMPRLRDMFTGGAALSLELSGSHFIPSPTAFDVEPVRTTQYEIGFEHQFAGSAAFDLTGFYRDVKGAVAGAQAGRLAGGGGCRGLQLSAEWGLRHHQGPGDGAQAAAYAAPAGRSELHPLRRPRHRFGAQLRHRGRGERRSPAHGGRTPGLQRDPPRQRPPGLPHRARCRVGPVAPHGGQPAPAVQQRPQLHPGGGQHRPARSGARRHSRRRRPAPAQTSGGHQQLHHALEISGRPRGGQGLRPVLSPGPGLPLRAEPFQPPQRGQRLRAHGQRRGRRVPQRQGPELPGRRSPRRPGLPRPLRGDQPGQPAALLVHLGGRCLR